MNYANALNTDTCEQGLAIITIEGEGKGRRGGREREEGGKEGKGGGGEGGKGRREECYSCS